MSNVPAIGNTRNGTRPAAPQPRAAPSPSPLARNPKLEIPNKSKSPNTELGKWNSELLSVIDLPVINLPVCSPGLRFEDRKMCDRKMGPGTSVPSLIFLPSIFLSFARSLTFLRTANLAGRPSMLGHSRLFWQPGLAGRRSFRTPRRPYLVIVICYYGIYGDWHALC